MSNFAQIFLCPVDFSEQSAAALRVEEGNSAFRDRDNQRFGQLKQHCA